MNNNQHQKSGGIASPLRFNRTARVGSWTVAMTLILFAVLVVVNLLFGALPSSWTKLDASSAKIYTVGATTEKYVSSLTRDVRLVIVTPNEVSATLQTFLDRYHAINSRVKVEHVDPIADPSFLDNYEEIQGSGSYIVVKSDLRYTVLDVSSLEYVHINDLNYSVSFDEYDAIMSDTTAVAYYAQYYGIDLYNATPYFAGEQMVTSAIEYVATEKIPHLYLLQGHGERELSSSILDKFADGLMEYEALTLQGDAGVPELASCVIIHDPKNDLTNTAYDALAAFMDRGGNLLIFTSPACAKMPNLMRLMEKVGLSATTGGSLHEGNANAYVKQPTILAPKTNTQHSVTAVLVSNNYSTMVTPNAHGITVSQTLPENVKVTQLMTASDAYVTDADGKTTDYGAVATAVAAENSKTGSKVIWFASVDAFSDSAISTYGSAATYYAHISAGYLNDAYTSALTGLEDVDLTQEPLTVPFRSALILGIVLALVVPIVIVGGGVAVWLIRRKR